MLGNLFLEIAVSLVVYLFLATISRRVTTEPSRRLLISLAIILALMGAHLFWGNGFEALYSRLIAEAKNEASESLKPGFIQIDISPLSELSSPEENLGLKPGTNTLAGIPFSTGWATSTQCSHLQYQPESLVFTAEISYPVTVYFLLQAGYGDADLSGQKIGVLHLGFSDGSSSEQDLVLGFNIRDWHWTNPNAVNTTTASNTQPAWQGTDSRGRSGGMDLLTFDIPASQQDLALTRIVITDTSREVLGDIDPCIHLLGLTIENLQ